MFTLDCDRAYLFAHPERELSAEEQSRYDAALGERARGVPAQYITGHQEFWGMDLIVTPAVLIPRPETEHVVETVLALQGSLPGVGRPAFGPRTSAVRVSESRKADAGCRVLDVGTGSGCIALALARELPDAEMHATDISTAALEVARANAARHQLENRIQFHRADLLAGLNLTDLDFVVSNLPYVGESEEDQVQLEVRKFEPRNAVFGGPTGTEVIARLIPQAHAALRPGGWSSWKSAEQLPTGSSNSCKTGKKFASSPIYNPSLASYRRESRRFNANKNPAIRKIRTKCGKRLRSEV